MKKYIWLKRTSTSFKQNNPVLLKNQVGQETDTHMVKVGDGVTAWNDLKYVVENGKSAYELAVEEFGFKGTLEEYLESLKGKSAYELAVQQGFEGTLDEYLESLKGESAYLLAIKYGEFEGTEEEYYKQTATGISDESWGAF